MHKNLKSSKETIWSQVIAQISNVLSRVTAGHMNEGDSRVLIIVWAFIF